ncbi:MAG: hypothetical protein WC942_03940 [Clostridia bacterium]|jgi:hypothetical protein
MKIEGRKIIGPNREVIAIPRGDGPDIIFIAEAVLDHKPFDKLCPPPKPVIKKIGGEDIPDIKDKNYQRQIQQYSERKTAWLVLTALQATKGLEWETVDLTNPSTWLLFRKELIDSGFSDIEINRIINGALTAQGLNEYKIEAARDRFLRHQQAQLNALSSLKAEGKHMQSGEPANDLESDHQE